MNTNTDKEPQLADKDECLHLREFKDFLKNVGREHLSPGINAITRNNNETYSVTTKELKAELISAIWNQLQIKQCPFYFQLLILRILLSELEPECRNAKENDFARPVSCNGDTNNKLQYDLVKLQKFVSNSLEKFLSSLITDNAAAGNLRKYADVDILCPKKVLCNCSKTIGLFKIPTHVVGFIKNKPRKMEDRNICLDRFSDLYDLQTEYSLYAVFDGHSGTMAANYASSQLPFLLAKRIKEIDPKTPEDYREALEYAFLKTDKHFRQKNISSGTTAVCTLISKTATESYLYVAWVGDSCALLVGLDASLQLVKSHKPDSPDERKRIEDAGGSVMFVQGQFRVNGFLNVARSIGDYAVGAVIAEPDFVDVPLTASHDFLVIGTDGLWDHVTEAAIINAIYNALEDNEKNIADISKLLIDMAKDGDSQDNITVVIVFLKQRSEIVQSLRQKRNVSH